MNNKNILSIYSQFKVARSAGCATFLPIFFAACYPMVFAEGEAVGKISKTEKITVEFFVDGTFVLDSSGKWVKFLITKELEDVTPNKDSTLLVGYYQDGWDEMVSLHDAKTKKQLGSVSCGGGVPTVYRFSKDNKFLGAKTSVGWFVWKIPSFEEVIVLGSTDFVNFSAAEQDGAEQPATAPESKSE